MLAKMEIALRGEKLPLKIGSLVHRATTKVIPYFKRRIAYNLLKTKLSCKNKPLEVLPMPHQGKD
jgi:hypothetical protein